MQIAQSFFHVYGGNDMGIVLVGEIACPREMSRRNIFGDSREK